MKGRVTDVSGNNGYTPADGQLVSITNRNVSKKEKFRRRLKVKICGITNLCDALAAQKLGADALGFVFYAKSPRHISPQFAKEIISQLNKRIKKVGVFVNPGVDYALRAARLCGLDILQFHGDESPEFCGKFENYKVIKAFRIKDKDSFKDIRRYRADYYMFDTFRKGSYGGTGRRFDWSMFEDVNISKPFFLSGGLTAGNVAYAVKAARPDWIDVSSGLEACPGKKDPRLLEEFMHKVRSI